MLETINSLNLKRIRMFGLNDNLDGTHAPEIPDQVGPWFNSQPLSIKILNSQNKIVLVDFWTYSCVNCLHTLPFIKKWYEKYKNMGLVIIGVHTPEFEFEKESNNVENFLKKEEIEYPVVLDNDYKIWNAFANHYWPRKYLIDPRGIIRYDHAGEGSYEETEGKIQSLLKEISGVPIPNLETEHKHISQGAVCYPMTPELYAGYLRGKIGNGRGFVEDKKSVYKVKDIEDFVDGEINLEGEWLAKDEFLQHGRKTEEPTDFVSILYHGLEVNTVLKSADGEKYKVYVQRDGKSLNKKYAGKDIQFDKSGVSFVEVQEPKLYNIIKDTEPGEHILKIVPLSEAFQLFAYTFGGCAD